MLSKEAPCNAPQESLSYVYNGPREVSFAIPPPRPTARVHSLVLKTVFKHRLRYSHGPNQVRIVVWRRSSRMKWPWSWRWLLLGTPGDIGGPCGDLQSFAVICNRRTQGRRYRPAPPDERRVLGEVLRDTWQGCLGSETRARGPQRHWRAAP